MSSFEQLSRLRSRIQRLSRSVASKCGQGDEWSYAFEGGSVTHYCLSGLKSLHEFEDQVSTLVVWVWTLRDRIERRAEEQQRDPLMVRKAVDSSWDLRLCADLANREKHFEPQ